MTDPTPLPEPAGRLCCWSGPFDGEKNFWTQFHHEGDPMPAEWDDEPPNEVIEFFTADQLRTYAAAVAAQARAEEREACAALIENIDIGGLESMPKLMAYIASLLSGVASAIRARGENNAG